MNDQTTSEAVDLRSYLAPIRRRKWIVLLIVVIAAAGTYLISSHERKTYQASTKLYIQVADPTLNPIAGLQATAAVNPTGTVTGQTLANVAQLITAQAANRAVSAALGKPAHTLGSVTATPDTGTSFVTIAASSHHAKDAADLANGYAAEFLRSRRDAVAATTRADLRAAKLSLAKLPASTTSNPNSFAQTQRDNFTQEISEYEQVLADPSPGAQQINPAITPTVATSPKPKRDAVFGGLVGLVLGIIAAFCLELLDRRLTDVRAVESVFGSQVLAVLPHVARPAPEAEGNRPIVPTEFLEALRSLTVVLRLSGHPDPPRTIMVSSTLPQEGKSTVTRDLALVYAGAGQRVLVIDADLRRPSVERLLGVTAQQGLVHVLRGEATLTDCIVGAVTAAPSEPASNGAAPPAPHGAAPSEPAAGPGCVDVLAHGEILASPLALLASGQMVRLLEDAYQAYDIVLLDTSPLLAVADCVPLLEMVDDVLLIARLGQTTKHAAARFRELVDRLPDVHFSIIANDHRKSSDDSYASYDYGYGSGEASGRRRLRRNKARASTAA